MTEEAMSNETEQAVERVTEWLQRATLNINGEGDYAVPMSRGDAAHLRLILTALAELQAAKWAVKHVDTMNDFVAMGMARDDALTALAHSEAEGRRLRESLTETVDALGQATGLLKACEDDIDINVVIAIRDGAGRIVRTLATLHSPTIIETGSAVLKRARAALTNKTEE